MSDDLSEYEKLVTEHGMMGYARSCLFDERVAECAWHADLRRGVLDLTGHGSFPIRVLGSHSRETDTFLWVWANPDADVSPAVADFASTLCQRATSSPGLAAFSTPCFESDWVSVQELASVCGELAGGLPFYLGDFGEGAIVVLVDTKVEVNVRSPIWLQQVVLGFQQFSHADLTACTKRFLERCSFAVEDTVQGLRARRADFPSLEIAFDANGRLRELTAVQQGSATVPQTTTTGCSVSISPKILVNRMTPTARQMLEAAIGRAAASTHYEVTIEHMLQQMLEPPEGDVAAIHQHFGVDRKPMQERVQRILQHMKAGNSARPVFTGNLWKWVEEAWTIGSLEYGAQAIRTGHMFYALVLYPSRYIGEIIPELEDFELDALRRDIDQALSVTREHFESTAGPRAVEPRPPHDAVEEALARLAVRRRAKFPPLLMALRSFVLNPASARSRDLWKDLFIAALEAHTDPLNGDAVLRAAAEASEAIEALAAPRGSRVSPN